jgi:hypothetical protein
MYDRKCIPGTLFTQLKTHYEMHNSVSVFSFVHTRGIVLSIVSNVLLLRTFPSRCYTRHVHNKSKQYKENRYINIPGHSMFTLHNV